MISRLFPHHITYLQFLSFVNSLSLFIPILKYAEASSKVRFDFSHIGISFLIAYAPSHQLNGKSISEHLTNPLFLSKYAFTESYSVFIPELS